MGQGGALNASMIPLLQDLNARYRVTHVLWHQGESDFALKTDPARYKDQLLSFVATLRANGVDAPVSSRRRPDADRVGRRETQSKRPNRNSPRAGRFKPGVDTDTLLEPQDRYDDCHFADSGEVKTAAAWAAILAQRP